MSVAIDQHNIEIQRNKQSWDSKPLLRKIYAGFYKKIAEQIDSTIPGAVVELGSGIGNLKTSFPTAITSDLFPNPWLDLVCDAYELPFSNNTISHLVLFDVFHHLEAPAAFFKEAARVLHPKGRVILFEPFISALSLPVYGLLHHEPVAWNKPINPADTIPRPRTYYAAQGNATRLFFRPDHTNWLPNWQTTYIQPFSSWTYLLSGGFSKPAIYPPSFLPLLTQIDTLLTLAPNFFGGRCLIVLNQATSAKIIEAHC